MLSVLKGERLSPLATRRGEARPLRLFPARRGEFKKACHGDQKAIGDVTFCKLRPLETYVTFANHEAAVQQYDYAALFFRPLFLVVDWW
ncbi:hypothetical protein H5410_030561 [Solanum commersonii]|uniref:Uncharacterized protein n=1 Tax=Solanum commersonii TaxID=4109 RepID=A0A9J5YH89_SOLCO|nr:hypothetical protein H5410_030561 [Solanum commersonii]